MKRLHELLGAEHNLDVVSRTLRDFARGARARAVGGHLITCSDESERECCDAFQQWFVQEMLPELKSWSRSPFSTANLGSQYEWGGVAIAEHHYATPESHDGFKLMVVKVNGHVAVDARPDGTVYGKLPRYDVESTFCGALHAMLAGGSSLPAVARLEEVFASEGLDRLAMLRDADQTDPAMQPLLAALVSTRLQARRVVLDIQQHRPHSPTLYLVLPCVTINRRQRDTELVVGMYTADHREPTLKVEYLGLGDDPSRYQVVDKHGWLHVSDDQLREVREARDHREMVLDHWRRHASVAAPQDERLERIVHLTDRKEHLDTSVAREALATLLWVLADLAPVPASILLFARGAVGIHHVYRAHRLARNQGSEADARAILHDLEQRVDALPAEQAQQVLEMLVAHHRESAS